MTDARARSLDSDGSAYGAGAVNLVRSVRRHPLIIGLVALAAVAAAALWLAVRSEPYEATAEEKRLVLEYARRASPRRPRASSTRPGPRSAPHGRSATAGRRSACAER